MQLGRVPKVGVDGPEILRNLMLSREGSVVLERHSDREKLRLDVWWWVGGLVYEWQFKFGTLYPDLVSGIYLFRIAPLSLPFAGPQVGYKRWR